VNVQPPASVVGGGPDGYRPYMAKPTYVGLDEAIALLGVKPATLYTYVSRGWVTRLRGARGSGYLRADLLRLKARHDARAGHAAVAVDALNWGQPVIDSAITSVHEGRLYYRGHDALGLAERGVAYEQVAELLFTGSLPARMATWPEQHAPPPAPLLVAALRPGAGPVRALSTAVALLRAASPRIAPEAGELELQRGRALIGWLSTAPGWGPHGGAPGEGTVAERVARAAGTPSTEVARALELALIASADHELNPSTFAARVVASAGNDLYACVAAGLAAMSGPLHGGATLRVETLLDEALASGPDELVRARLGRNARIPGFGHPLYPAGDPRAQALLSLARTLGERSPRSSAMFALERAACDAGVPPPTLDFGMVALSEALGLPKGTSLLLFSVGRLAGWIAHVREQRMQNTPIRPRARYVGPLPPEPNAPSATAPERDG
jgi:citrate synthase